MKKRLLPLLLALCLALSLLPCPAMAATEIKEVYVTYDEPVTGQDPATIAVTVSGEGVELFDVRWWCRSDQCRCEGQPLEAGKSYTCNFYFKAKRGYVFPEAGKVRIRVNGEWEKPFRIELGDGSDGITFSSYYVMPGEMQHAMIQVESPCVGEHPVFSAQMSAGTYITDQYYVAMWTIDKNSDGYVKGVQWWDTVECRALTAEETFQPGHAYSVFLCFRMRSGVTINENADVTVNGAPAERVRGQSAVEYHYTFPALPGELPSRPEPEPAPAAADTVIGAVALNVTAPAIGYKPAFTATVPDGAGYAVNLFDTTFYEKGVGWMDEKESTMKLNGEAFREGKTYTVAVRLVPRDGYAFAQSADGKPAVAAEINGQPAEAEFLTTNGYTELMVTCTFPKLTRTTVVGSVSVSVDLPAPGKALPVPGITTANVETGGYYWESDGASVTGQIAEAGKTYRLTVKATAPEGYKYTDHTAVLIAGRTATISSVSDSQIWFYYDFKVDLPSVSRAEVTVTVPVAGQKPDFDARVTADSYNVTKVVWWELDDEREHKATLTENDTFKPNTWYQVWITAAPSDGYEFTSGAYGFINGEKVGITKAGEDWKDREIYNWWKTGETPVETLPFQDVTKNDIYYDAVAWVYENGIMSGFSADTFGPHTTLSRAMVVQVLYNKEGKPATGAPNPFSDVPDSQWFFNAVRWGAHKNVVAGFGGGVFRPDDTVTVEQVCVILHNYSGKPAASGSLSGLGAHSDWAEPALRWATANGILTDVPFANVNEAADRAQTAQMLANYLK